MTRGTLISFEGLDRVGKTTQIATLKEATGAVVFRYPDRKSSIGQIIDSHLRGEIELDRRALAMLFSADRWKDWQEIEDHLRSGRCVIVDRYVDSAVAYGRANGLTREFCRTLDAGLHVPDTVVYLVADPSSLQGREAYGTEVTENSRVQNEVVEFFEEEMDARWVRIDASGSIEEVSRRIFSHLSQ